MTPSKARELYLHGGPDALTTLRGAFLVCVWDARSDLLVLVNDRFGLYPHYWTRTPTGLAFAPAIAPLTSLLDRLGTLDEVGLAQYLRFQQFLGDRTWFTSVRVLPNATVLSWRASQEEVRVRRYWDCGHIGQVTCSDVREAAEQANVLFDRAIERCASNGRVGVYLSGGLDSRQILGCLDHLRHVPTITFGSARCLEVHIARRVALAAGADPHWMPMDDGRWVLDQLPRHLSLTEGLHSWIHAHGIHTLDLARTVMDVALSGFAGGTVLARTCRSDLKYDVAHPHRYARSESEFVEQMFKGFVHRFTWPGLEEAEARSLLHSTGRAHWLDLAYGSFLDELTRTAQWPPDRRYEHFFYEQQDRRLIMPALVFTRSAVDVECPFLDYDFVDFRYALPFAVRCHPRFRAYMLTRRMPALARIPYDRTGLPPHASPWVRAWGRARLEGRRVLERAGVVSKRPVPYADYENYLRADLRPWAEWLLFDRRTAERGFFDPAAVRSLWERHLAGYEPFLLGKIAPLMTIEMSMRYLVDGDDPQTLVPEHVRPR